MCDDNAPVRTVRSTHTLESRAGQGQNGQQTEKVTHRKWQTQRWDEGFSRLEDLPGLADEPANSVLPGVSLLVFSLPLSPASLFSLGVGDNAGTSCVWQGAEQHTDPQPQRPESPARVREPRFLQQLPMSPGAGWGQVVPERGCPQEWGWENAHSSGGW